MAINENQITAGEDIAKVLFTIQTDKGVADKNDQLFLLNQEEKLLRQLIILASSMASYNLNGHLHQA